MLLLRLFGVIILFAKAVLFRGSYPLLQAALRGTYRGKLSTGLRLF